jgi:hypothetical protein
VPFVCAEALLVNPTQEITPDNNKLCKTLSNNFSLIAVRPNPADNVLNVSYLVTETADVSLEIIDILGKRVIEREMGSQTANIYDLSINTDELPEGMYYVRLNVGKDRIAQKLLISHP